MKPFDFVNRANAEFIDRLYEQYQRDPRSLDEQWQAFFTGFDLGQARTPVPSGDGIRTEVPPGIAGGAIGQEGVPATIGVFDLVHSYRELGHFIARLDPLGHDRPNHPLLDLKNFGMTAADLDREVGTGSFLGKTDGTLRDLIEKLRVTYCGTIGVEYIGISDKAQRDWLQQHMEPIYNQPAISADDAKAIMFQLVAAEEFERFLHTRYIGQKRFSLEGGEALVPLLNTIVDQGALLGGEKVFMAMAHRGRLNVLAHVLNKPYEIGLSEFEGTGLDPEREGDGDVKYHLGYANTRPLPQGKAVKVSLLPNPSHLELIDPIQQG
ncbi:MAG: 2-oxoglutarate dehydrogenase E1 subunit family protein, partial [Tepidisphaeraceae bacterium]